ncbi:energy-coupling factor ABC transporter permease [Heliophilum fasciatum]|uniref:Cobalt/nickel transport system permease protein n=1 Tax=Heliophilum fasciatum TaxID=35700 RepID=A0A4R2RP34_9FIRM|nr:energy-coupling factor ABC transporter permease [Heliophilum fasciatum]MCW2277615.1 cobalt/nickel transport system permease protein [Heliophilum fasciatum]TCP64963.1 cobalt/nickel transport system permease protein [Heliophilum fasciatum]
MHIPDGFLDAKTWIGAAAISSAGIALAVKKTRDLLDERQVPWMGVMSAFIFAAQMINFPIVGGTSGHLLGALLAGITLGPWPAMLVMTTILGIQCFFFQDGGLTALGANILNMAVVGVWSGYGAYRLLQRWLPGDGGRNAAVFIAAWLSVLMASLAAAVELALAGTLPFAAALPAMAGWHALIGVGEGLITMAVIQFVWRVRPDLQSMIRQGGVRFHEQ